MNKKTRRKHKELEALNAQKDACKEEIAHRLREKQRALDMARAPDRIRLREIFESQRKAIDADALEPTSVQLWHLQACIEGRLHHLCTTSGKIFRVLVKNDDAEETSYLLIRAVACVSVWIHKNSDHNGRARPQVCPAQGCDDPTCTNAHWQHDAVLRRAQKKMGASCCSEERVREEVLETYVVACNNADALPVYGKDDVCKFLDKIFPGKVFEFSTLEFTHDRIDDDDD